MKRDLTNSRTYLPPRVRVVETCAEQGVLSASDTLGSVTIDELDNVNAMNANSNADAANETFYFGGW